MTAPSSDFSQITAVSRRYFLPRLADNVFLGNVLLNRAKTKGWLKTIDGGVDINIPLEYAIASAAGSYSGSQTLDIADNDVFSAAKVNWKQYYAAVSVSGIDKLKNAGSNRIVDFVKSKMKNAEKTLRRKLASTTGIYSAGGTATEIVGLQAWINTDETVGGISQTNNSFWRAQEDTTTTTLSLAAMQTRFNACSEDSEEPTMIATTKSIYNSYWGLLTPQQRFTSDEVGKAGFKSLMFNSVPVVSDTNCPSGDMYFLNEDYLHLFVHRDENFRQTEFQSPVNQNVVTSKIYWAGEFASSNNRYHGAFKGLTG